MINSMPSRAKIEALAAKAYARDLFGIVVIDVSDAGVTLAMPHRPELGHRPGAFQGAVVSAIGEYAAAWSAIAAANADYVTLTIEQSIRFIGPADGQRLIAAGRTISAGRSISVATADIYAERDGVRRLCAILMQTNRHALAKP